MFRVTSIDSQAVQPTTKWSFTMANILVLKSSILGQYSQSNALIDGFLADHQSDTLTIPSYERGVARLLRYDRHP